MPPPDSSLENVYVTVGTTKFDGLMSEITSEEALRVLKSRGCKKLILQFGKGNPLRNKEELEEKHEIQIEQYDFKYEPVRKDILDSSLTIGHAGAGTCMDILDLRKPGLLVTNEELMDNHQLELAEQMAADDYIYHCSLKDLVESLRTLNFERLKKYAPNDNMNEFISCLNRLMS